MFSIYGSLSFRDILAGCHPHYGCERWGALGSMTLAIRDDQFSTWCLSGSEQLCDSVMSVTTQIIVIGRW